MRLRGCPSDLRPVSDQAKSGHAAAAATATPLPRGRRAAAATTRRPTPPFPPGGTPRRADCRQSTTSRQVATAKAAGDTPSRRRADLLRGKGQNRRQSSAPSRRRHGLPRPSAGAGRAHPARQRSLSPPRSRARRTAANRHQRFATNRKGNAPERRHHPEVRRKCAPLGVAITFAG